MLEVGLAMSAAAGESVSGDMSVVAPFPGGVLVAVVDGLGHGAEAAHAAQAAVEVLREGAGAPLERIFETAHERLVKTRGAVISAATFDHAAGAMTWLGVGNVEAQLLRAAAEPRATESIFLSGGVVGYRLPTLRPNTMQVTSGDTVVFATDGVDVGFSRDLDLRVAPGRLADRIIAAHANGTDDALVLVARLKEQT